MRHDCDRFIYRVRFLLNLYRVITESFVKIRCDVTSVRCCWRRWRINVSCLASRLEL